jgi:hypothetical protein
MREHHRSGEMIEIVWLPTPTSVGESSATDAKTARVTWNCTPIFKRMTPGRRDERVRVATFLVSFDLTLRDVRNTPFVRPEFSRA